MRGIGFRRAIVGLGIGGLLTVLPGQAAAPRAANTMSSGQYLSSNPDMRPGGVRLTFHESR